MRFYLYAHPRPQPLASFVAHDPASWQKAIAQIPACDTRLTIAAEILDFGPVLLIGDENRPDMPRVLTTLTGQAGADMTDYIWPRIAVAFRRTFDVAAKSSPGDDLPEMFQPADSV